jgi:ferredoxin-NADP reductase
VPGHHALSPQADRRGACWPPPSATTSSCATTANRWISIPGQFIQVHFEYADGTATKRSYSLATLHDHALAPGEAVEIAVSFVPGGAATALFEGLDDRRPRDASGPFGRFCLMPATTTSVTC